MPPKPIAALLFAGALGLSSMARGDDASKAKPKVNYQDHVAAIFASRCNSCHNADKAKGGLALETFGTTIQGGGSGKVVEAGDLAASHLWGVVSHDEEPKMPPNGPKIPDAELDLIKLWIEGGALETSGSVAMIKERLKFEFKLDPSAMGKPVGPPAMPEAVSTEPYVLSPRANAIMALASSPWAPLVAVAGHKQVLLYQAAKRRLVGVLPFPEGSIHVLKFSRNGALLLAGGGRGGQSGLAVVFDVKTGRRVFEIGKEFDAVLAADISPDHGQVAIGGPSKVVRVYGTADGQLQFEMKKHTEWVTALEFSPDGVLLASGDRNSGLIVWEAQTGREYFELRGHTLAISDVSWRLDSNVLASASEDGSVRLWEMENGGQIKNWAAHGGGVASARFSKDGRLATSGRDRMVRLWDQDGGKLKDYEPFGDLALRAEFADDDAQVVAGDWSGEVRAFDAKEGKRLGNLAANPEPIARRLDRARAQADAARAAGEAAARELGPLRAAVAGRSADLARARQAEADVQAEAGRKADALGLAEKGDASALAAEFVATEASRQAQAALDKAKAELTAAERAITRSIGDEKAARDALAASKASIDKALEDRSGQDQAVASAVEALKAAADRQSADRAASNLAQALARSAELTVEVGSNGRKVVEALAARDRSVAARESAPGRLDAANARARAAGEALASALALKDRAGADRGRAAAAMGEARAAAQPARTALEPRKADLANATAALASAEKALAEKRGPAEALASKAAELRAEVDALAAEQEFAANASAASAR